jgi:hypothetical protein
LYVACRNNHQPSTKLDRSRGGERSLAFAR